MITITLIETTARGEQRVHAVQAAPGTSLMDAAVQAGIGGIAADCGGMLTCATCHVIVQDAWRERLVPAGEEEIAMLEMTATPASAGSRLSCQIVLEESLDGLTVDLPASQY